ncbi:doublecortin domain-containing protein 2-like isoform X2 [Rhopilema esculentum]|uniref:doublecortin domain-containing protein 2-like isoform X2 n=1 Tax=Rhopilema esculentum TaxID=499914 RepID=UPI0031DF8FA7
MAAPVITIYRNGDTYQNGKRLVLNRKEIRSFDAFLDRVTKDTRSQVAVRSIRTPSHGHRVNELDKLENGGIYVAVGPEKFKKLEYKEASTLPTHKQKPPEQLIRPVVHSRVIVSGRARKVAAAESSSNKTIFVFRNGDDKQPCFKIHLDKRILHTGMDTILQFVTEKVRLRTGAVRSLYTLDGIEVLEPAQLKSLEKYVAVGYGKKFLKMAYSENGSTSLTPRKGGLKLKSMSSEPPHRKKRARPPVKALSQGHVKTPVRSDKAFSDKDDLTNSTSAKEPSDAHSIESDKANHNDVSLERSLTQDLPPLGQNEEANNNDSDDREAVSRRKSSAEDRKSVQRGAKDDAVEEVSTPEKSSSKEKKGKTTAEQRKAELKAKLKGENQMKAAAKKTRPEKDDKKEDKVEDLEEDDQQNEPSVFKATGDQGESGKMIKENEETNVDKPVDMLPAEEVEEELEANATQKEDEENTKTSNDNEQDDKVAENSKPTEDNEASNAIRDSLEDGN